MRLRLGEVWQRCGGKVRRADRKRASKRACPWSAAGGAGVPVRFAHIAHPPGLVAAAAQLAAATGPPRLRVRLRADGGPIGGSAY